jgi:G3E family GTPase
MIPVTLLTGFLGSGKTTLLSRLLHEPAFARTAVLINEFGEIGLDHDLIEAGDETVVALSTGCLCCRVSSNLVKTLALLEARRLAGEISFDRVVIETSGLVDPVPILQALGSDRMVASSFLIGGVVTTVDAVSGASTIERYAEAQRQVAMADILLVTKTDVNQGGLDDLMETLSAINKTAPIMDARSWTGDLTHQAGISRSVLSAPRHSLSLRVRPHRHSHNFSTISIVRDRPLSALTLPLFLEGLAAHLGPRVLRAKGLIAIREMPEQPMAIHSIQHMIHKPTFLAGWPSAERQSRIVLIGHDLPERWPGLLLDALEAEVASIIGLTESAMLAQEDIS